MDGLRCNSCASHFFAGAQVFGGILGFPVGQHEIVFRVKFFVAIVNVSANEFVCPDLQEAFEVRDFVVASGIVGLSGVNRFFGLGIDAGARCLAHSDSHQQ